VTASHRIAQEEIFGPVLSVMTFRTPEEAIEGANNTPCGLSAGVWKDKGSKIFKIVDKLRRHRVGKHRQQIRFDHVRRIKRER
jgi:aldehyde dehydrogenase (NAD+)